MGNCASSSSPDAKGNTRCSNISPDSRNNDRCSNMTGTNVNNVRCSDMHGEGNSGNKHSSNMENCTDCEYSSNCRDCTRVNHSSNMTRCTDCDYCSNCTDCSGLSNASNQHGVHKDVSVKKALPLPQSHTDVKDEGLPELEDGSKAEEAQAGVVELEDAPPAYSKH